MAEAENRASDTGRLLQSQDAGASTDDGDDGDDYYDNYYNNLVGKGTDKEQKEDQVSEG